MSLSSCFLILLLFLSLFLIRCCCSFFSICHFSYLYLQFSYPLMLHFLFVSFPVIHPRCDKLTWVYLLFSKLNLSQMLEFDNSWRLMTTRIFPILSGIVPDEKHFTGFLSLSGFSIIPDDSNTSILISLTNPLFCLSPFLTIGDLSFLSPMKYFNLRDSFFLILESWMGLHVMYSSAMCS